MAARCVGSGQYTPVGSGHMQQCAVHHHMGAGPVLGLWLALGVWACATGLETLR